MARGFAVFFQKVYNVRLKFMLYYANKWIIDNLTKYNSSLKNYT